jgi:3-deoxy-D-manno-octulosonic-acid transferase
MKGESLHLRERLGLCVQEKKSCDKALWIHAVSVGEVLSVQNLAKRIKAEHPNWVIYFSSLTFSGLRVAADKLNDVDKIFYIPFDFNFIVKKFFRKIKPDIFVLVESEFWPNLLRSAKKYSKGVLLINGRISKKSHKIFSKFKFIVKKVLENIDIFLVQTDIDKKRLEDMGINGDRLKVAGNLKAEIELPILSEKQVKEMKDDLNIPADVKVVIAGSTRKGEEEKLLNAFAKALEQRDDLALIIAPRHLERTDEIVKVSEGLMLPVIKRTRLKKEDKWKVLILDTIGELSFFYSVVDAAFIGGSLVPWGGQNFLEPAFYGKPIFFGPHMDNFAYLAELFINRGAAKAITCENDLLKMFLFKGENNAKETLISLQGATDRIMNVIEDLMNASERNE